MDQWVGLTIGQVLKQCGANFSDVELLDEPPGKLRAVQLTCYAGERPQKTILEIKYHTGLFSPDRSWPQALVEAQKIARVHRSRDTLF